MAEKFYFLAYKSHNGKGEKPATVTLNLHGEEIVIPFGKTSSRPYPQGLANALRAKSTRWSNGVVITCEEAKGNDAKADADAKAKADADAKK